MAIGNSGGSAATRFRPRGTAPVGGLGRRSLLAEDSQDTADANNVEEEGVSTAPQTEPETAPAPTPRRAALGTRLASPTAQATATETLQAEPVTGSLESQMPEQIATESDPSSTSIDQSPSSSTPTRGRQKRGRPVGSTTKRAATPSSRATTENAFSVSDARARMREIEQEVKHLRTSLEGLRVEYEALSQSIVNLTFGS